MTNMVQLLALAAVALAAVEAVPAFRVSKTLSSHMVLDVSNNGAPAVLWGFGAPGAAVSTTTNSRTTSWTTVGKDGVWRQQLTGSEATKPSLKPYTFTCSSGGASVTLSDVLLGRTILCSGQVSAPPVALCLLPAPVS